MIQFLAESTRFSGSANRWRYLPRHLHQRIITLVIATVAVLFAQSVFPTRLQAASSERPNIVFILADDLGYGDVKCFGGDRCQIETPNFDRLATEGMKFTDAHANASVCVPTRVAIMTGCYPWRFGPTARGGPWGFLAPRFTTKQHTLGKMLKAAGYQTGYVGKWHLGTTMQTTNGKVQGPTNVDYTKPLVMGPVEHGFDRSFILPGSLDMYPYAFVRNNVWVGDVTAQKGWSAFNRIGPAAEDFEDTKVLDTFSREAEQFIKESADRENSEPFFLFFSLTSPHTPMSPSSNFLGKSKLGLYGDFVMETDHCVGRVLAALDKQGVADNTLVIVTSDHGPAPYAGRLAEATFGQLAELQNDGHFSSGPYRGSKFSVYEGGLRVPFVARWPGTIAPQSSCTELVGLPDMMSTFAEIADVKLTADQAPDSFSLLPLLKDPFRGPVRHSMIMEGTRGMVIRSGNHKLALCPGSGSEGRFGNTPKHADAWRDALKQYGKTPRSDVEFEQYPFVQLFAMESDPHENENLAEKYPAVVGEMIALLKQQITNGGTRKGSRQPDARKNIKPISAPPFVWGKESKRPELVCRESDDAIVAMIDGMAVLRYNKSVQTAPDGISKKYERSGYIHPIVTPSGIEVTGDFPPDHPHQHALFNAWTNTTFQGHDVDFWNQMKQQGRVSHEKVLDVSPREFTVQLLHEDTTNLDAPVEVLRETWRVEIRGVVGRSIIFDITSKQTCVAQSPLKINQYRYGGMGLRGHNEWFAEAGAAALKAYEKRIAKAPDTPFPSLDVTRHRFTTSDDKRRFDGNHSRPDWVDLSGKVDGKLAGVTVMGHRSNFRFPQPVRLHPSKPYFCFAPMVIGEFEIAPGETYVSRFRYIVHDGDVPTATIDHQWNDFQK